LGLPGYDQRITQLQRCHCKPFSGLSWSQLLDHATRELFLSRTVGLLDVVTCLEKTHDKQWPNETLHGQPTYDEQVLGSRRKLLCIHPERNTPLALAWPSRSTYIQLPGVCV